MVKKKVILYFGSFNPVHKGHIAVADSALEALGADELWFVVSPQNPFKKGEALASEKDRLNMVETAVEGARGSGHGRMMASDVEFAMPKPSRTIDTLRLLSSRYPDNEFILLIGADNADGFEGWKEYESILSDYSVAVYPREGYLPADTPVTRQLTFIENVPLYPMAATPIRELIAGREEPGEWLPTKVWDYIKKHKLYGYQG